MKVSKKRLLFFLLAIVSFHYSFQIKAQNCIYVASNGIDTNAGTISKPVLTLQGAILLSRKTKSKNIIIKGGDYFDVSVKLGPQDSGLSIRSFDKKTVKLYAASVLKFSGKEENGWLSYDIPGSKNRSWDFRMILVNGSLRERARIPKSGGFTYLNEWNANGLTATDGYWDRKPSFDDTHVLKYINTDVGRIDINNAEVTINHQWQESYIGIQKQDTIANTFTFAYPTLDPLGSFAKERGNSYVIWNIRDGMQKQGQWYLDRTYGKLFYWPIPGETRENITVIVPRFSSIFELQSGVKGIKISDLTLSCGTNKLQNEGFAGREIDALVTGDNVQNISLTNLKIQQTTGSGIKFSGQEIKISNCELSQLGGGGIFLWGNGYNEVTNTSLSQLGMIFNSSAGLIVAKKTKIKGVSISSVPYSGIIVSGDSSIIENCNIEKVMQKLNDGAAIYSSFHRNIIVDRNEILGSDNTKIGIYFDERSKDCLATNNIVINSDIPIHCHLASNITFSGNTFYNYDSQTISSQNSDNIKIDSNKFICRKLVFENHGQSRNESTITSFSQNTLIGMKSAYVQAFKSELPIVVKNLNYFETKNIDLRREISVGEVIKLLTGY